MYKTPFTITAPISSNAFSYEKRKDPKISIPSVIEGALADVELGDEVTFEDYDEHGVLQSCKGLKNLIKSVHPKTGKPVIVVDNHNHVFYFWYEAWHQGKIDRGITLIHVDAHRDTRIPERNMTHEEAGNLEKVFEYTNTVLNVGNYIPPAMEEGLIGELVSITSEAELEKAGTTIYNLQSKTQRGFILNIDLDFWAPEMDYIDKEKTFQIIRPWMMQAKMITIATSPFFIEQKRAIRVLHELFEMSDL